MNIPNDYDNLREVLDKIQSRASDGALAEALLNTEELIEVYPNEPAVWNLRGYIFGQQGEILKAIDARSTAISLCDKEPHYFYMRGIDLFSLGKYTEAISDFSTVIELCDYYKSDYYRAGAYFFRADASVRVGDYSRARVDCAHIEDGMTTWTDKLRSKADILADCQER